MQERGAQTEAYRAVATLYNALVTAMVVSLVARHGSALAREYVFRHFRRQHLEKFLPGLAKLGLAREPHAVACALYHYHSNALGGVHTEYVRESDRKAWVRYPPPRWMWRGTAIAAIPHEVSAAMLHGWHGHNGVSLGNPRLGFVCTGMTVDGMPGLEGYYLEHDRELAAEERVRFEYGGQVMPAFDPAAAPRLDSSAWPAERLARTHRRYAMEYVRTMIPVLQELLGAPPAGQELGRVARLVGLQFYAETALPPAKPAQPGNHDSAHAFGAWFAALLAGQGEEVSLDCAPGTATLHLPHWRLAQGVRLADLAGAFHAWNELWIGAGMAHDRFLRLKAEVTVSGERLAARWRIGRSGGKP